MDIVIPNLAESVTEGDLGAWLKKDGERVEKDDLILELETDKATVELAAEASGTLEILVQAGQTVHVGDVVGRIVEEGAAKAEKPAAEEAAEAAPEAKPEAKKEEPPKPAPGKEPETGRKKEPETGRKKEPETGREKEPETGRKKEPETGREKEPAKKPAPEAKPEPAAPSSAPGEPAKPAPAGPAPQRRAPAPEEPAPQPPAAPDEPGTRRERMTRLRRRIAERLVEAQRTAAILTTFNEIDMTEVMELRKEHQAEFEERHGIRLGFMSLFAKASVLALRDYPRINAFIDGEEIVYHDHVHLGIAVGTPRGLVVPVLRNADRMTFAEIERAIQELATRARDGELTIEELQGGTFTISNGGIYGSLMSTPILNPPQSGILGMHKIERRPVTLLDPASKEERIESRSMMYVALSYDHRIVDGEEAVSFLVKVKERLENPVRLLLDS
ncbi:MAG TPA: 2-oxoglutarate dehydrogenase complex dihydrolipoyllysine-residue succinyltransferase [Gemmatimonadota bacterium]|nr:2-oxoglutarate dehydrogenase complex dihydrolipoyllysine-residue succinyltransferase [Gemmatimonadota bacterium]